MSDFGRLATTPCWHLGDRSLDVCLAHVDAPSFAPILAS